ncbi:hypothetical protein Vafri_2588 [Volvox africanus]|nr:hypothetical protein Vafri_2588 [Volvox africanus]
MPSSVPTIPPVASHNQQPWGLTSRIADVAIGAAAGATRLWDAVMLRVVNVVRTAYHLPHAHSRVADPQDDQTEGDAAQRGNPSAAAIVQIAVLVLLFSSLVLGAANYSLARAGSRVQAYQQEEVYELREQLGDWQKHSAATSGEFWEQLRGVRLESQRLGLRLVGLESKLETVVEEVRSLQRAIEAHNAVRSIVQGDAESGGSRSLDSDGVLEALRRQEAPGAAAKGAALAVKGLDDVGLELQGLAPCHLRRLVAAAGPLLPARVTRHSMVIGDETALMRFHWAMSFIFARGAGTSVHPIARHLTDPAATPTCLPLAVTRGAANGSASGSAFVELRLMTPAIVSAISFRYPAYGTWDTSSALLHLSATVHEAPAASGTVPTLLKGRNAVGGESMGDAAAEVRSRRVELPPLQGLECQHLRLTSMAASAAESPGDDGSRMLVHGVTLHVNGNFGNPDYSCMPQVLVHGWVP